MLTYFIAARLKSATRGNRQDTVKGRTGHETFRRHRVLISRPPAKSLAFGRFSQSRQI